MNRTLLPVAAALAASLAAQGAPLPQGTATPADVRAAWQAFTADHGKDWRVEWSQSAGTPNAVWGPGLRIADEVTTKPAARLLARGSLDRFAALLGRGHTRFVQTVGEKVRHVHIFVYRQFLGDLEVLDGRADVRIHDNGVLSLIGSNAYQIPTGFSTMPTIDGGEARIRAFDQLKLEVPAPTLLQQPKDRLVVWASGELANSPVRLAWEIDVDVDAANKIGRAYIDAKTGAFLQYRTDLHECFSKHCESGSHRDEFESSWRARLDASRVNDAAKARVEVELGSPNSALPMVTGKVVAWTRVGLLPDATPTLVPVANLAIGSTFTDANGDFTLPGTSANVTITLRGRNINNITPNQGTKFSRTVNLTGTGNTITIYAANPAEYDASQTTTYHYTNESLEFAKALLGPSSNLNSLSGIVAVVNQRASCNATFNSRSNLMTFYHDSGATQCVNTAYAGVIQHEWGHGLDHWFNGIAGTQMQEGLADTIAMMQNDDPIIGPKFFRNRTPNYVRTGLNTKVWPPSGGTHAQGEVWMGFMWDTRNELVARLGQANGLKRLRELFLGIFPADPRTQQAAAREVALIDDDNGNLGDGTPNCQALVTALNKRKIPNPIGICRGLASYGTYGAGCKGTAPRSSNCFTVNGTCANATTAGTAIQYAIQATAPATGASIVALELLIRSRSGTVNNATFDIHLATTAGAPAATAARTVTATVTTSPQWYRFALSTPLNIPAGQKFFILYRDSRVTYPFCASGANRTLVPYFFRRTPTSTWTSVSRGSYWAVRVLCPASNDAVPQLDNVGLPILGRPFSVDLSAAKAASPAVLLLGASKSMWGTAALPFDLTPLGAAGCLVLASGEATISKTVDAMGKASTMLTVPNDASLVGKSVFNQYVVLDSAANSLGVAVTRAGEASIGR